MDIFLGILYVFPAIIASTHAILKRRDPHAAAWWVVVVWILPLAGPFLYYFFGINRIERKSARLRKRKSAKESSPKLLHSKPPPAPSLPPETRHLSKLSNLVGRIISQPLTFGNTVMPLIGADEAHSAMIRAIDGAQNSVGLSTYIFKNDSIGQKFIDALARARERRVEVRVLIDDVGAGFFWSGVDNKLRQGKAPVAYFLPALTPWRMAYFNMRNHRKILTVDGKIAFTGSMNIGAFPITDTHFRLEGPVVAGIQETFRLDWAFTTGEFLGGDSWFPNHSQTGQTAARGISSGPDEDFDNCRWILLSALVNATKSIRIVTPYFVPDATLINALNLAAMSGVRVDIVLPQINDLALVRWASQAMLWQVLQKGCRVWRTPPPFDHSKLMIIDDSWALIGSSNWDRRSLRLNFEFDLECYDKDLAAALTRIVDGKIASAREVTLAEVDSRSLPVRLRDGASRLFSPLL